METSLLLCTYYDTPMSRLADQTYYYEHKLFCAAPRDIPLGTPIWVRRSNGSWLKLIVRDRYSKRLSRRIDLSRFAARLIMGKDYKRMGRIKAKVRIE